MKIIRSFYSEQIASIYEARLKEAGIPCFLSNTATSQLVPFGDGGVNLHVSEDLFEQAHEIIDALDINMNTKVDEDFRDANLEDIQYEQGVHEFEQKENQKPWESKTFVILALLMLIVLIFSLILNFKPI